MPVRLLSSLLPHALTVGYRADCTCVALLTVSDIVTDSPAEHTRELRH
jgi:hypothetical protein